MDKASFPVTSLTITEAEALCTQLISGSMADEQIVEVLTAMRDRGESAAEVAGFSRAIVAKAPVIPFSSPTVDVCGTGGSGLDRFNVSTAAAFVLACFGLKVAKHGNRGSQRPNGSFDLLEALGFPLDLEPDALARCLEETNLAFFFARKAHPAMKAVAEARKAAGGRTIFNLAGPLSNPTNLVCQVIGTADAALVPVLAEAAGLLGRRRCAVVWGEPGIDELSMAGTSVILQMDGDHQTHSEFRPENLGLPAVAYEAMPKGLANDNAAIFLRLLEDEPLDGLRDMVCLNAGLALKVSGSIPTLGEGYALARRAVHSGDVMRKFQQSLSFSQGLARTL